MNIDILPNWRRSRFIVLNTPRALLLSTLLLKPQTLKLSDCSFKSNSTLLLLSSCCLSIPGGILYGIGSRESFSSMFTASTFVETGSLAGRFVSVSYTHLRAHETPEHLVC